MHIDFANYLRLPYSSASNGIDYFNASFVNVSDISSQQVMNVYIYLQYNAIYTDSVSTMLLVAIYIVKIFKYIICF